MTERKPWRNRKERKEWGRRLQSEDPGLEVVHSHAAGIDVGNGMHYVAVRPDRDPQPVRRFECFTADLHCLAEWLQRCGVKTVAMQSTGVYWIPIYEILEERGMQVYLVNARHTKNLPGRKSDVQESQWLLKLHTYGLLNNSFQPPSEIRVLRTYWRQRGEHVRGAATCIQRMQKALTQMNVQLANVISDVSGLTGQTIVRSIVAGEHDPRKLAELSDPRIHASREQVAKSLEGNWRPELLFVMGGRDHATLVSDDEGRAFYLPADCYRNAVGFLGHLQTIIRRRGKGDERDRRPPHRGGVGSSLY